MMDKVLEQLNSTYIDGSQDNEEIKTGFDVMYKNWGRLGNQDQRRRDILENQKSNRSSKVDTCRGILDLVEAIKDQDLYTYRKAQYSYRPSIYVSGFTKAPTTYRNVLMMSEWLVEKPMDFEENWYVVPCPTGVRTLVVACQGDTKCYNKYGFFRMACRTALPGGNPCEPNFMSHCVVLDCFHVQSLNTLYVLDVLAWNNVPMTDGETEFRNYWLKSHIEDIPELKTINTKNKVKFEILPKYECDPESFNKFMMTCPHFKDNAPNLDGLLFYHKKAHYVSGATPLVGWLYPFMVKEVLGSEITVQQIYTLDKPADYVNQAKFIQEFESKVKKGAPPFMKHPIEMDTSADSANGGGDKKKRNRNKSKRGSNQDAEMAVSESGDAQPSENETHTELSHKSFLSRPQLLRMDQDTDKPSTDQPVTDEPLTEEPCDIVNY